MRTQIVNRPGELINSHCGLILVLFVSLTLKIVELLYLDIISPDSARYIAAAHMFIKGDFWKGVALYRLPAYPLLLAFFYMLVGSWKGAGIITSLLPTLGTTVSIYLISARLFSHRAAFWSATAFALSPYLNRYGLYMIRDPMFWFLTSWALYFGIRFLEQPDERFLLGCLGTALLAAGFRVEGVIFLSVYLWFLVYAAVRGGKECHVYLSGAALWFLFPLLVAAGLYYLFGSKWSHLTRIDNIVGMVRNTLSSKFLDHYLKIYNDIKNLQLTHGYSIHSIQGHSVLTITRHYMPLIYMIGILECFFRMLYPLYGIPLIAGLKTKLDRRRALPLVTGLALIMVCYLFLIEKDYVAKRYLGLPVICLLPWVGEGMERIIKGVKDSLSGRLVITLSIGLFFVLPIWKCASLNMRKIEPTLMEAGHWIASTPALANLPLEASDNRILIYAGHPEAFPEKGLPPAIKQLVSLGFAKSEKEKIVVINPPGEETFSKGLPEGYTILKSFRGNYYSVTVYGPSQLKPLVDGSGGLPQPDDL